MGRVMFGGGKVGMSLSPLPKGYAQLAYIQSSGTQYIDTGVVGKSGIEFAMKFMFTATLSTSGNTGFGSWSGGDDRFYPVLSMGGALYYGYGSNISTGKTLSPNTLYDFYIKLNAGEQSVSLNGTVVKTGTSATNINSGLNMHLFATNVQGNAINIVIGRIYSCQIYDNGTLVRDFVPCLSEAEGVGLYDLVEKKFYGNDGTGNFIGSEVA